MISVLINFFVQVLIVRYLSKEGYGAFAYGYSIATLAARVTPLGTDKAISRFIPIYHEEKKVDQVKGALLVAITTTVVMGVLLVGLAVSTRNVLAETVVQDPLALSVLLMIIALAPLIAMENILEKLLAVFGRVKSLFIRRYVLTPLLRLSAVCGLMATGGDAVYLAGAYVVATVIGVFISAQILWRILRDDPLLAEIAKIKADLPTRRLFRFGVPLLSTDVVYGLRTSLVVVLLEFFHGTTGVAAFRAILPVARLNQIVFDSFKLLYVPTASRMFARGDTEDISQLYWRSSAWIALLTLPVLLISFSLATPVAVLLFGETYASSGPILAAVSMGLYLNAAFGFNALTLRVFKSVRTIMKIDLGAGLLALILNVIVVPIYGPLGGAIVSSFVMIVQNVAYQVVVMKAGQLKGIPAEIARIHAAIIVIAVALLLVQTMLVLPVAVGLAVAVVLTLIVWATFLKTLQIRELFPEIDRFLPRRFAVGEPLISDAHASPPVRAKQGQS
ncbi:Polysaccharide biosynthesis protein [Rhodopirellula maiorica SM1]|uniref:Polysaccharide biosynthesis protein n=2 Tax=Novipirellula TaxID=2795426 RepID=M5RA93_9BACT|nr:Polysaccharide biosynthesis protein [Rhodopirellula maiorica SM1]